MTVDISKRRPAKVASDQKHSNQRRFQETAYGMPEAPGRDHVQADIEVYRSAESDTAEVRIDLAWAFNARIRLTPDKLRRLASDLLDAAADIEAHPAASLCQVQAA